MSIKLLHTADLHLDRPFLGLGNRRLERRAEMQRRFEEILDLARTHEVLALLIAGDLFDRAGAHSVDYVKAQLAAMARHGIRTILIPGNHDPLDACPFYRGDFPPGVHVFRSPELSSYDGIPGLSVHGLAYRDDRRRQSPLAGFKPRPDRRRHVAMVHGQLLSSTQVEEDYAPFAPAEIAIGGLDYLALGHFHNFQDCSVGRTKAFYPGSPCRLGFGETAERRVLLVELTEGGTAVTPIALADRRFILVEGDAGRPDLLYEQLLAAADPDAYVRVRLSGRAGTPVAGLVADLRQKLADRCYGLEIQWRDVTAAPLETQEGTVAHVFSRLMADRLAKAPDEESASMVHLAGDYGLLALEGRELP